MNHTLDELAARMDAAAERMAELDALGVRVPGPAWTAAVQAEAEASAAFCEALEREAEL